MFGSCNILVRSNVDYSLVVMLHVFSYVVIEMENDVKQHLLPNKHDLLPSCGWKCFQSYLKLYWLIVYDHSSA
jgi:hypothetical protein